MYNKIGQEKRRETMIEWWDELILLKQIFYTIAIPATLILVIQAIFSMLGLSDMDGEMDGMDGIGSEGVTSFGDMDEIFEVDLEDANTVSDGFVGDFRFFTFSRVNCIFLDFWLDRCNPCRKKFDSCCCDRCDACRINSDVCCRIPILYYDKSFNPAVILRM